MKVKSEALSGCQMRGNKVKEGGNNGRMSSLIRMPTRTAYNNTHTFVY